MSAACSEGTPHVSVGVKHRALFLAWQQRSDSVARDSLVDEFMPLACNLARRYGNSSESMDDLTQVAAVGLLLAIDRFDVDRGHRFESFAVPTILGEMRRYFRNSGWALHVPRSTQEQALAVRGAQRHLEAGLGHAPTVAQICAHLDYPLEHVIDGLQALDSYHVGSLDAPVGGREESASYAETLGWDEQGYGAMESRADLRAALAALPERDRAMLGMSFFGEMTQSEIAEHIGTSQMQISRRFAPHRGPQRRVDWCGAPPLGLGWRARAQTPRWRCRDRCGFRS
jgi:RNA polymerase sigma-B factor